MKELVKEETVLFISVLKWFFIGIVIGIAGGIVSSIFLKTLNAAIFYLSNFKNYYLFLPLALILSLFIRQKFFPDVQELSTDHVIKSFHTHKRLSIISIPKIFIGSILTISFGGSAGREAPCADICASIASAISNIFKFSKKNYQKMIICGVSAGFASAFGVPLSGALFGVEVLFVGQLFYDALFPAVVSGIVSYYISSLMGVHYFKNPLILSDIPSGNLLLKTFLFGIIFGIISLLTIELIQYFKKCGKKIQINPYISSLIAGLVLVVMVKIFNGKYLGLSMNETIGFLNNNRAFYYDFLLKIIFTAITINFGGIGGLVTPLFFIGASSGSAFAQLLGEDNLAFYSSLGFVSVLAGTLNTPLSASVMAIELFGPSIAPYAIISSIVSFLVTGHRSLYPSQNISFQKSPSIKVITDTQTGMRKTEIIIHKGSLLYLIFKITRSLKKIFNK